MAAQQWLTETAVRERSQRLQEPAWLLEDRLAALKRAEGLPLETSPLFTRHTENPFKLLDLPPGEARPLLTPPTARGAHLRTLEASAALKPALLNDLPAFEQDKTSAMVRALFTDGAVLHVERDVDAGEAVLRYDPIGGASFARNLFVLDPGARATVLLEVQGQGKGLLGLTAEVLLGAGAHLRLLTVDTSGDQHSTVLSTQARTGEGASLEAFHAFTGGALTKSRSDVVLQGRGSRVAQGEVVFGRGQERFDLTSNILHQGPETTSDALSKAALKDSARANIKGVITLLTEAKDSDSYLQQHAMLLSKQARCIAIPSLEIVNREIKRAKHAATVAQVDENQIYYLQTRGLSEDEARKAIVMGFLGPLLQRLPEAHAERIQRTIEARWS